MAHIGPIEAVGRERDYQRDKWSAKHDRGHDPASWLAVIAIQLGQYADAIFLDNADEQAFALSKLAAVCLAALEHTEYSPTAFERPGRDA